MEAKIISRGKLYLTPLKQHHLQEIHDNLHPENIRELKLMGYDDIMVALEQMLRDSDCYLARKEGGPFLFVGGLWFDQDQEFPQVFAMFSKNMKKDYVSLARGSRMLINFFDQMFPNTTMTILSDYEGMLNWATWLGYEPVGIIEHGENSYVEFVRCTIPPKDVYDDESRPMMH